MSNTMTEREAVKELYRLLDKLDAGTTGQSFKAAHEILLAARQLSRIGERECNGVKGPDGFMKWNEDDQRRADNARERHQKRVTAALESAMDRESFEKLEIEFQGDPRGAPVLIHLKNGEQRAATFY